MSKKLLMIPGPTEFNPVVLKELGQQTESHVSPKFIADFGSVLENLRKVFLTKDGQPFVVSGSGTLGWDFLCANLLEEGDKVLVLNTGYFSDSFAACAEAYGATCTTIQAKVGGAVRADSDELKKALAATKDFKLIALTQVDTSTSVCNDIAGISKYVRSVSPNSFIAVDGVCSIGAEELRFDAWDLDFCMTCSQKALGCPPGLSVMMSSQRLLKTVLARKSRVPAYFANMKRWLPIMTAYEARKPSYFATPNVNLVSALKVALDVLVKAGMENVFKLHKSNANKFRAAMSAIGLTFVPLSSDLYASTITAVRFPKGVTKMSLLPEIKKFGIVLAGGLHKDIKMEYFRVGHMGLSVMQPKLGHMEKTVAAIEKGLTAAGYKFESGKATSVFSA